MKTATPTTTTPGTNLSLTTLLPLAVLGIGGLAVYKYFKSKEVEKQEDKEQRERISGYKEQSAKSASNIADIKNTFIVSGKDALNRPQTKNVNAEIQALFSTLYNKSLKDKDFGTIPKVIDNNKSSGLEISRKFYEIVSQFPLNKIYLIPKYYSIFSGKSKSFYTDVKKLSAGRQRLINQIFTTAQKKGYRII